MGLPTNRRTQSDTARPGGAGHQAQAGRAVSLYRASLTELCRRTQSDTARPGGAGATLSAAPRDAGTGTVTLTMQADDADIFTVQRRVAGEPDFSEVAANVAADADGNATYEDTIAAGNYEYQVVPFRGASAGDASNMVPVVAA